MKNLKYQKFIFIFIFILSIDKSFEQFCTDTYCTINTDTGSNTYSIKRNSYTNSIKYRPKYLQTDDNTGRVSCHDCPEISIGSIYSIDANGNCYVGQCPEGGKILDKTNECTSLVLTSSLYLLGDVYYCDKPDFTNCEGNICECSSYYYIEYLIGNKKKYHCFKDFSNIPSDFPSNFLSIYKYYNYKTNEFYLNKCPEEYRYMKLRYNSYGIIRCSDSCEDSEFVISVLAADNHMNEYCVDDCKDSTHSPDDQRYIYEYINNGDRSCLENCPIGTYKKQSTDKNACVPPNQCKFYALDKEEMFRFMSRKYFI